MSRLTEVNTLFLRSLANLIDVRTPLIKSSEVPREARTATERLIEICRARGASVYLTGPTARAYIDAARFADAGIVLRYANYAGYPEYQQGTAAFDHHTSLLDPLFNCGPGTRGHLKSLRDRAAFMTGD
jgi:WbqC-like protein family